MSVVTTVSIWKDDGVTNRLEYEGRERRVRTTLQDCRALREVAHLGTDCSPADDPESFYRSQLQRAIGIAARAS